MTRAIAAGRDGGAFVFDAAEVSAEHGKSIGIHTYARQVFRQLVPLLHPGWQMHLACSAASVADFDAGGSDHVTTHVVLGGRPPGRFARQWWQRFGAVRFARRVGAGTYFSPKGFLPGFAGAVRGLRTVAVVHDLIPLWYAEQGLRLGGRIEEWVVNAALRRTCRQADALIVDSCATREDVVGRGLRAAEQVEVIHLGVDVTASRSERPRPDPYLFAMTSPLPHKNAATILDAYARYRRLHPAPLPLVVAGITGLLPDGVLGVGRVDERTLHTWYAHAEAFLFLSRAEGFGFPPLEAMTHGTPVLCSDIPALREVTGGAAVLVPPLAADIVARQLCTLLDDPALRRDLAVRGREVAARYRWATCGRRTAEVLAGSCT